MSPRPASELAGPSADLILPKSKEFAQDALLLMVVAHLERFMHRETSTIARRTKCTRSTEMFNTLLRI